jgi:hypothetical protein
MASPPPPGLFRHDLYTIEHFCNSLGEHLSSAGEEPWGFLAVTPKSRSDEVTPRHTFPRPPEGPNPDFPRKNEHRQGRNACEAFWERAGMRCFGVCLALAVAKGQRLSLGAPR